MSENKQKQASASSKEAVAPKTITKKKHARKAKKQLIGSHAVHEKDTGSVPVQIALRTEKITMLTDHLKAHPKDDHARRGLMMAVGERRKLLKYLKDKSKQGYEELIGKLGLRH